MKTLWVKICLAFCAVLLCTGCAKVIGAELEAPADTIYAGDTPAMGLTLAYDAETPSEGDMQKALADGTWSSSDPNILTVDATGTLSAIAPGRATITYTNGKVTDTAEVEVIAPVESIKITTQEVNNLPGRIHIAYEITPAVAQKTPVHFSSSNINVMTLDETGGIQIHGAGTTTVTVTAENGVSATQEITAELYPLGISLPEEQQEWTLAVGNSSNALKFELDFADAGLTDGDIYFAVDDKTIADYAYDTQQIVGLSEGETTFHFASDPFGTNKVDVQVTVTPWVPDASTERGRNALAHEEAKRVLGNIITPGMSEYQKAQAIYNYLAYNVATQYNQSTEAYKTNFGDEAYSALILHKAACSGFCWAVDMMCEIEGLECEHWNQNMWAHQWNRVKCDGQWVVLDAQGQIFGGTLHPLQTDPAYYDESGRAWYSAGTNADGTTRYVAPA